jgi:ferredoxin-type protein NapG
MSFLDKLRRIFNKNPIKGHFKKNRLRPPGAVEENRFMSLCIRCARCIEVCPYNAIKRADFADHLQIGTPYIYPDQKACYLCMRCPAVCPTNALDTELIQMEKVAIGRAFVDEKVCLNYQFANDENKGSTDGMARICNTCYNVCPLQDEAIVLKQVILPVVTDKCVGCGICTERCPTNPKAINIFPSGMDDTARAGFHYQKSRFIYENSRKSHHGFYKGKELMDKKKKIQSNDTKPDFTYDFEPQETIDDWD